MTTKDEESGMAVFVGFRNTPITLNVLTRSALYMAGAARKAESSATSTVVLVIIDVAMAVDQVVQVRILRGT